MLEGKQLFIFDFHKISSFHRTKQKRKKKRKCQNFDTSECEYSSNGHVNGDRKIQSVKIEESKI